MCIECFAMYWYFFWGERVSYLSSAWGQFVMVIDAVCIVNLYLWCHITFIICILYISKDKAWVIEDFDSLGLVQTLHKTFSEFLCTQRIIYKLYKGNFGFVFLSPPPARYHLVCLATLRQLCRGMAPPHTKLMQWLSLIPVANLLSTSPMVRRMFIQCS